MPGLLPVIPAALAVFSASPPWSLTSTSPVVHITEWKGKCGLEYEFKRFQEHKSTVHLYIWLIWHLETWYDMMRIEWIDETSQKLCVRNLGMKSRPSGVWSCRRSCWRPGPGESTRSDTTGMGKKSAKQSKTLIQSYAKHIQTMQKMWNFWSKPISSHRLRIGEDMFSQKGYALQNRFTSCRCRRSLWNLFATCF